MSLPESPATRSSTPHSDSEPRSFVRALSRLIATVAALALLVVLLFAGGFLWFAQSLATQEPVLPREADGIVVLTGGASRIEDAVALLAEGHGRRLLITGVHPSTSSGEIARVMPRYERLLTCCVDLDHSAVNTVGNAAETRRWAKALNFRSLIVVTSSYHMTRAMAELGRQLPDFNLIPFSVVTEKMKSEPWWASAATARVVFSEYVKYLVAQLRMRLEPPPDTTEPAPPARATLGT